jgi:hypothetical protein
MTFVVKRFPISASGSLGAVAGMMAAPIVHLDPDMMTTAFRKLTIKPMIRAWSPSKLRSTSV